MEVMASRTSLSRRPRSLRSRWRRLWRAGRARSLEGAQAQLGALAAGGMNLFGEQIHERVSGVFGSPVGEDLVGIFANVRILAHCHAEEHFGDTILVLV